MSSRLSLLLALLALPLLALPEAAPAIQPKTDRFGDPLPEGTIARLGTGRLWQVGRSRVVAYAPDGKTLATGTSLGVALWDARTGERLTRHFDWGVGAEAERAENLVALGFSSDGRSLLAAWESEVHLLPSAGGKGITLVRNNGSPIWFATFTPDSRYVVIAAVHEVRVVEIATGQVKQSWRSLPPWSPEVLREVPTVGRAALSPDGKVLALLGWQGSKQPRVWLWDVATGEDLTRIDVDSVPELLAFSPDGRWLAVSAGFRVHWLDPVSGVEQHQWRVTEPTWMMQKHLTFSPDGKLLAGWGYIHDVETGEVLRPFGAIENDYPNEMAFSPDSQHLALRHGGFVEVQDALTGKVILPGEGHRHPPTALALRPDGRTLATAAELDGSVRLWNPRTGQQVRKFDIPRDPVSAVCFGGRWLAYGEGHRVRLLDVETGKVERETEIGSEPAQLALSADGRTLLVGLAGDRLGVQIRAATTGQELCKLEKIAEPVVAVALAPEGKVAAVAERTGSIRVWDALTGRVRFELEKAGEVALDKPVACVLCFAPDGRTLATCGRDGVLRLWDANTGRLLREGTEVSAVAHLAFSADGRLLAGGGQYESPRVWEVASLQERFRWNESSLGLIFAGPRLLVSVQVGADLLTRDLAALGDADNAGKSLKLADLWDRLVGEATPADRAIRALVALRERAVPLLGEKLQPVPVLDGKLLERLIADLDAEDFDVRDRASAELARRGEQAEPALLAARKTPRSAEHRRRLEELLARRAEAFPPERLRVLRAIEALEEIGTPQARAILERLAKREPTAEETRQARAALERLGGNP
jgi:WD40 repeat protein